MNDISLDYFKVFEAVLSEGSVTHAAAKLHVTQPAVSNALRRMRDHYEDPLFTRTAEGMRPTAKARAIWPAVHDGLRALREASNPGFDPATTQRTFRVALTDYTASLLSPPLVARLAAEAPRARLVISPNTDDSALEALRSGTIDAAVGVATPSAPLTSEVLRVEERVLVMRKGHALASGALDMDRVRAARHVAVSLSGQLEAYADTLLSEAGLEQAVVLVVNQFTVAAQVIAHSDLVGVLARGVVDDIAGRESLAVRELPVDAPPVELHLLWHRRDSAEPGHRWLRAAILEAAAEEEGSGGSS
ncbi:MAG: LysR family transcriptional regulator [Persicimonas sp.]